LKNTEKSLEKDYEIQVVNLKASYETENNHISETLSGLDLELEKNIVHERDLTKERLVKIETQETGWKNQIEVLKNEIKELKEQITQKTNRLNTVQSELTLMSETYDPEDDKNKKEILEKEINIYLSNKIYNSTVEIDNKKLIDTQKQDKFKLEETQKNKSSKMSKKLNYENAKNILLKDLPNFIIDLTSQDLEDSMNQFISNVFYKDLSITLQPSKTSLKLMYGQGKNKKPGHLLSGFERSLVNIAFKSTYSIMADLGIIIMDEPDATGDQESKASLNDALIELKDVFGQVIIVSHSQTMIEQIKNSVDCNLIHL
jgi:DNA repair exonuclease SbcCD ATPase subunit